MPPAKRAWTAVGAANSAMPPAGPYSTAVRAGSHLYVSGITPRDPGTGSIGPPDVRVQSRRALGNLRIVLESCGAGCLDVAHMLVHLADPGEWEAFNEVWQEFFQPPFPARTVVGAPLRGGILVEVTAVAYLPEGKAFDPKMTLV